MNVCVLLELSKGAVLRLHPDDPPFTVGRGARGLVFLSEGFGEAISISLNGGTSDDIIRSLNTAVDEYVAFKEL